MYEQYPWRHREPLGHNKLWKDVDNNRVHNAKIFSSKHRLIYGKGVESTFYNESLLLV